MKVVTMDEVADKAGVSRSAVSFVFNNKYDRRVKPNEVDAILKAAEELDYHPDALGRSLAMNKVHTIGVALYEIDYITTSTYFITIIAGMEEIIGRYDYNMQFTTTRRTDRKHNQNLFFLRKVKERRVDGLIIIDQYVNDEDILTLQKLGIPFVLVDKRANGIKGHCVLIDHKDGMYQATEHLAKMGHKRIGFLHAPFYEEELIGYKLALINNGLKYNPELVWKMGGVEDIVEKGVSFLLSLKQPPTAILTSDDVRSAEAMNILRTKGFKIPEDIAVIGFNDLSIAELTYPPLTTIRTPLRELGEKAMEMLLKLINGENIEQTEIILKPELIIRDSCGAKKSNFLKEGGEK